MAFSGMLITFCSGWITILLVLMQIYVVHSHTSSIRGGLRRHVSSSPSVLTPRARYLETMGRYATVNIKKLHANSSAAESSVAANGASSEEPTSTVTSYLLWDNVVQGLSMEVGIGIPATKFQLYVDTGSDTNWVRCLKYSGLGGPVYDPRSSSTYRPISCTDNKCNTWLGPHSCNKSATTSFCPSEIHYGQNDSVTKGKVVEETLTFFKTDGKQAQVPNMSIECANVVGDGLAMVPGLVGLMSTTIGLPLQLGINQFSYCFVIPGKDLLFSSSSNRVVNNNSTTSGVIYLGPTPAIQGPGILTTPLVKNTVFYAVNLLGVSVEDRRFHVPPPTRKSNQQLFVLDSGTTPTLLPKILYSQVFAKFKKLIDLPLVSNASVIGNWDRCYNISSAPPNYTFPSFTFHLKEVNLSMPQNNYIFLVQKDVKCLAFLASPYAYGILGNIMQQSLHILYNLEKSEVSFRPTDCARLA